MKTGYHGNRKRIGYGSLDWDGNRNAKVWLQNEFLETIEKLEPEKQKKPLGDLAKQPLEQYVALVEKQDRRSISRRRKLSQKWEQANRGESFFSLLDENDPLRESIQQWGEAYHLNSAWCHDVALQTLQDWRRFKNTTGNQFTSLPFYSHSHYLGFGSLVMRHTLANMPRDTLNEKQKAMADSFTKQDRELVEAFTEQQRDFLSAYPHDPHAQDDKFFIDRVNDLIEMALPPVNHALPVLNLLSEVERLKLRNKLLERAKELLERVKEIAKKISSVKPKEVGDEEVSKHLEWAVRYQVFDESFYSIEGPKYEHQRDRHRAAVKVRKASVNLLAIIDLTPRPTTKGRKSDL